MRSATTCPTHLSGSQLVFFKKNILQVLSLFKLPFSTTLHTMFRIPSSESWN